MKAFKRSKKAYSDEEENLLAAGSLLPEVSNEANNGHVNRIDKADVARFLEQYMDRPASAIRQQL
jgi:hypothetical protein